MLVLSDALDLVWVIDTLEHYLPLYKRRNDRYNLGPKLVSTTLSHTNLLCKNWFTVTRKVTLLCAHVAAGGIFGQTLKMWLCR